MPPIFEVRGTAPAVEGFVEEGDRNTRGLTPCVHTSISTARSQLNLSVGQGGTHCSSEQSNASLCVQGEVSPSATEGNIQ